MRWKGKRTGEGRGRRGDKEKKREDAKDTKGGKKRKRG